MGEKKKRLPKPKKSDYLEVVRQAAWINENIVDDCFDNDYYRIIDFYVVHSPCEQLSCSPNSIDRLGWKTSAWNSNKFREAFDRALGLAHNVSFLHYDNKNHILEMIKKLGLKSFPDYDGVQYAIISGTNQKNPRKDLLYRIRDAFAHGRFTCRVINGECYFYLEDASKIKGLEGFFVTGRMCIKKSSLVALMDFLEWKKPVSSLQNLREE